MPAVDDLVQCEDGVWRTVEERQKIVIRRDRWIEAVYQALRICSIAAWIIVVGWLLNIYQ